MVPTEARGVSPGLLHAGVVPRTVPMATLRTLAYLLWGFVFFVVFQKLLSSFVLIGGLALLAVSVAQSEGVLSGGGQSERGRTASGREGSRGQSSGQQGPWSRDPDGARDPRDGRPSGASFGSRSANFNAFRDVSSKKRRQQWRESLFGRAAAGATAGGQMREFWNAGGRDRDATDVDDRDNVNYVRAVDDADFGDSAEGRGGTDGGAYYERMPQEKGSPAYSAGPGVGTWDWTGNWAGVNGGNTAPGDDTFNYDKGGTGSTEGSWGMGSGGGVDWKAAAATAAAVAANATAAAVAAGAVAESMAEAMVGGDGKSSGDSMDFTEFGSGFVDGTFARAAVPSNNGGSSGDVSFSFVDDVAGTTATAGAAFAAAATTGGGLNGTTNGRIDSYAATMETASTTTAQTEASAGTRAAVKATEPDVVPEVVPLRLPSPSTGAPPRSQGRVIVDTPVEGEALPFNEWLRRSESDSGGGEGNGGGGGGRTADTARGVSGTSDDDTAHSRTDDTPDVWSSRGGGFGEGRSGGGNVRGDTNATPDTRQSGVEGSGGGRSGTATGGDFESGTSGSSDASSDSSIGDGSGPGSGPGSGTRWTAATYSYGGGRSERWDASGPRAPPRQSGSSSGRGGDYWSRDARSPSTPPPRRPPSSSPLPSPPRPYSGGGSGGGLPFEALSGSLNAAFESFGGGLNNSWTRGDAPGPGPGANRWREFMTVG